MRDSVFIWLGIFCSIFLFCSFAMLICYFVFFSTFLLFFFSKFCVFISNLLLLSSPTESYARKFKNIQKNVFLEYGVPA